MSREAKILIGIVLVITVGMVTLFMVGGSSGTSSSPKADAAKLVNDASHKTGSGPVTLVEFGDFECPACGQAYPIVKQIKKDYEGKVTFVFRNFPLQMHKNAIPAANAAEAAAKQDKFWEMHDKLYEGQADWSNKDTAESTFVGYAKDLGLDVEKFQQDVASDAIKKIVERDISDGNSVGVASTPTFYVNGTKADSYEYSALKSLIDDSLKK